MRLTRHAKQTLSRIELRKFEHYERQEHVDDDYCVVGFAHSEPVQVALLSPEKHIDLLEAAAERFELDGIALVATARAALAAPDRVVTLKVSAPLAV